MSRSWQPPSANHIYPITGCVGTGVHPRYSIEELQANHPKHFALFILSYLAIQGRELDVNFTPDKAPRWLPSLFRQRSFRNDDQDEDIPPALQFSELGGIHGLPYEEYKGDHYEGGRYDGIYDKNDPKDTTAVPPRFGGYCNHGSLLFPTWHRPYVLAIEQAISFAAIRITRNLDGGRWTHQENWTDSSGKWDRTGGQWGRGYGHGDYEGSRWGHEAGRRGHEGDGRWGRGGPNYGGGPNIGQGATFGQGTNQDGEWTALAKTLRFPFWDWADERVAKESLPPVLYTERVVLEFGNDPDAGHVVSADVSNPLAYFKFNALPDGFRDKELMSNGEQTEAYFAEWLRTYRHAASEASPGDSNIADLNEKLKTQAAGVRTRVALLFSYGDNEADGASVWDDFANHSAKKKFESGDAIENVHESIEGIHDSLHVIIGGNGHMGDPDYAGFDPIFYLHHCNVDRLLALWEYIYPNYWIGDPQNHNDLHMARSKAHIPLSMYNGKVDATTKLAPFRNAEGGYWTSDQARFLTDKTKSPDYTYPEIAGIKVDEPLLGPAERATRRAALQKYYGFEPTPTLTGARSKSAILNARVPVSAGHTIVPGYRHIVIAVQTSEFVFNNSYSIEIHYNKDSEDTFVGAISVFARHDQSACANCISRRAGTSLIRGIMPVPQSIIDKVLASGDAAEMDVAHELKKHLHAAIIDRHGGQIGQIVRGQTRSQETVLKGHAVPQIKLISSAAARADSGPAEYVDGKDHGEIFESGQGCLWKAS